jgi:hypothetical protein
LRVCRPEEVIFDVNFPNVILVAHRTCLWHAEINERVVSVSETEREPWVLNHFSGSQCIDEERTYRIVSGVSSQHEWLVSRHSQNAIKWFRQPCLIDCDLEILKVVNTCLERVDADLVRELGTQEHSRTVLARGNCLADLFGL